jgi:hypothetical protein
MSCYYAKRTDHDRMFVRVICGRCRASSSAYDSIISGLEEAYVGAREVNGTETCDHADVGESFAGLDLGTRHER